MLLKTLNTKIMALYCLIIVFIVTAGIAAEIKAVKQESIVKGVYGHLDGQVGYLAKDDTWIGPSAIAIDLKSNIYIADNANERIVKFDKSGKFASKINFNVMNKRYDMIIDDLATDLSGNLYVASRHEMKIAKFSPDGKPLSSINIRDKKICWSKKKYWHDCAFQIEGINLDHKGNIYLKGFHELIKFDSKGNILKKLASEAYAPQYFLDEVDNLYINIKPEEWEKYDAEGKSLGSIKCTEPYFTSINGRCRYPIFIDKNGFIYLFDSIERSIAKKDIRGRYFDQYKMQHDYANNTFKFGTDGSLYIMELEKKQFMVEKINWGQPL